jgi:hypothetical protein
MFFFEHPRLILLRSSPVAAWLSKRLARTGRRRLWDFPDERLVARFSQIEGYKCFSLTRALDVVKCQLALV